MDLLSLCETIKANAGEIGANVISDWGHISGAEPWLVLPDRLDLDHIPQLVRQLAAASLCTDFDRALCQDVIRTAADHGDRRRGEGYEETLLHREYHLLRRALADRLRRMHGEDTTVFLAMMRIDALTTLAIAAALHGFHRKELEERGRWPAVIERLLDDWPLPST